MEYPRATSASELGVRVVKDGHTDHNQERGGWEKGAPGNFIQPILDAPDGAWGASQQNQFHVIYNKRHNLQEASCSPGKALQDDVAEKEVQKKCMMLERRLT